MYFFHKGFSMLFESWYCKKEHSFCLIPAGKEHPDYDFLTHNSVLIKSFAAQSIDAGFDEHDLIVQDYLNKLDKTKNKLKRKR